MTTGDELNFLNIVTEGDNTQLFLIAESASGGEGDLNSSTDDNPI